jgi:hypothetical protein
MDEDSNRWEMSDDGLSDEAKLYIASENRATEKANNEEAARVKATTPSEEG